MMCLVAWMPQQKTISSAACLGRKASLDVHGLILLLFHQTLVRSPTYITTTQLVEQLALILELLEQLIALADSVIRIDGEGRATEAVIKSASKEDIIPEEEDTGANRKLTSLGITAIPISTPDTETTPSHNSRDSDINRSGGDLATYLYYFKSVGWVSTVIFMLLQLVFGFLQAFPSKSKKPRI